METTIYLHRDKEDNWETASELGKDNDEKFMDKFRYAGYEVEFSVRITDDGETFATHINGVKLEKEIQI